MSLERDGISLCVHALRKRRRPVLLGHLLAIPITLALLVVTADVFFRTIDDPLTRAIENAL